ncbi:MAG: ankyrin repeat domain-containing protein [Rhodoferax sp.]|nr:ankyrin repeat domain-containing protein [Rhodoferax sp.]
MRFYFKYIFYLIVFNSYFNAYAGSYEDFFAAVKKDDPVVVRTLLQRGFDPNTVNPDGDFGLILGLRQRALQVVGVLLSWPGTKIEVRTSADESPLMLAALKGHLQVCKQLISLDADVNKTGWTPLHYAATGGHVDVIRLLLEHFAYIDAASPNGSTPLMMAAMYGTPAAVKVLLEAGADPTLRNEIQLSALDFAVRAKQDASAQLIEAFVRGRGAGTR